MSTTPDLQLSNQLRPGCLLLISRPSHHTPANVEHLLLQVTSAPAESHQDDQSSSSTIQARLLTSSEWDTYIRHNHIPTPTPSTPPIDLSALLLSTYFPSCTLNPTREHLHSLPITSRKSCLHCHDGFDPSSIDPQELRWRYKLCVHCMDPTLYSAHEKLLGSGLRRNSSDPLLDLGNFRSHRLAVNTRRRDIGYTICEAGTWAAEKWKGSGGMTFACLEKARKLDTQKMCAICREGFERSDVLGGLECGHIFHGGCLEWMEEGGGLGCPLCRG